MPVRNNNEEKKNKLDLTMKRKAGSRVGMRAEGQRRLHEKDGERKYAPDAISFMLLCPSQP